MNTSVQEPLPPGMLLAERLPLPTDAALQPSARPAALLQLDDARLHWPGAREFGPFCLHVNAGERIAIVGPSGAGKSTLLKLMAGEWPASAGEVLIGGQALARWPRAALARRRAVLPQSHAVAFGLPVELVVSLGRMACEPDPEQPRIALQALRQAQAAHLHGRRFDMLSGGEQARVMLARVFAQLWDVREALLLVDEPLAALDPGLQFELTDALIAFCSERGHALIAVLHDLNLALGSFGRLWLVRERQLSADMPAVRAAAPALEALFGIGLRCIDGADGRTAVLAQRACALEALA